MFSLIFAGLVFGQFLELPEKVSGRAGEFIVIRPLKVEGGAVQYFAIDPGLSVFPGDLLADKTTLVVTGNRVGKYRILAYTAKGDKPSPPVILSVSISRDDQVDPAPNPGPAPGPNPPPGPGPSPDLTDIAQDPIFQTMQSLAGGLQEANQAANLAKLGAAWAKAPEMITTAKTLGAWNSAVRAEITRQGVPLGALAAIRQKVGDIVADEIGQDPATSLVGDPGRKAENLAKRFAAIFGKLGGG